MKNSHAICYYFLRIFQWQVVWFSALAHPLFQISSGSFSFYSLLVHINRAWHYLFSRIFMAKFTFSKHNWCSTSDIIYTCLQTVVFCLVDIYIMLGKAFVPYLEGLSSTQLRLVTIYANRISQARSGAPIDANQWVVSYLCTTWTFVWIGWNYGFHSFVHLYRNRQVVLMSLAPGFCVVCVTPSVPKYLSF
jgi:hypothetical protein